MKENSRDKNMICSYEHKLFYEKLDKKNNTAAKLFKP